MNNTLLSFIILCNCVHFTFARNVKQDIGLFEQRADSCLMVLDNDCALMNYELALSMANDENEGAKIITIGIKIAQLNFQLGELDEAYRQYNTSLRLSNELGLEKEKAKSLKGLADIYWRYGENVKSISTIINSIEIFTQLNDTSSIIEASNVLAEIYTSVGNTTDAARIYDDMLNIAIATKDTVNIAKNYEYKGVIYFFDKDYGKAIDYYKKALNLNEKTNNKLAAGINNGNIGEAYSKMGEYVKALNYFDKAIEIEKEFNFNSGLIFLYYSIGETYTFLEKYKKGQDYYRQSIDLMDQIGETREKQHVYSLMADNYARQKNFNKAFTYHQLYTQEKDSLFNATKFNQLEEIRAKYEIDKKDQENYFLANENKIKEKDLALKQDIIKWQNLVVILLIIFLAVAVYLSIRLYNNRKLLKKANTAKDKLFGIVAHDLKGPIGNIKILVELLSANDLNKVNSAERDQIMSYLQTSSQSVSILLNDLLAWSISQQEGFVFKPMRVNLLECIQQAITLFNYQIQEKNLKVSNEVSSEIFVYVDHDVLSTIVRNLLSNAIKFTEDGGAISFRASQKKKRNKAFVEFSINDNGIGISKAKIAALKSTNHFVSTDGTANEKGSGLGINMIKEFVRGSKGEFDIESTPKKGTTITVRLPASS
ncbi:MAG TPA: tetratricopeptide repeat-containing sensor histidine kinase [Fulvivirga sp.]|nr:tetratricopeptide repeat-containing sensor histidine kinase [Fulvivirga sp.]